ncbi:MAG: 6-carboxytetrahydropterin synthase [Bacteroidales bacterium]|nr:6-carboxytetrahydropterin synthase [Bacteroidales bacterium]
MIYITRRERFNAAHRLFRKDYTDEENLKVFGKCSNPNWHGHNYVLYVTVKGEINPETGFLMNLSDLSRIIRERIVEKVDHKNINLEVDFMAGKYASTEILAESIWHQIADDIENHGARLHCVRLQESENNYVEYFGE